MDNSRYLELSMVKRVKVAPVMVLGDGEMAVIRKPHG